MSKKNGSEVTKAGLNRAIMHLSEYEKVPADELMEILGVLTNDSNFAGLVQSLWKVVVCEIKLKLHDDIKNLNGEMTG